MKRRAALVASLALFLAAPTPGRAARPDLEKLMAELNGSVVPVRFTLRPIEPPPGGEGQKVEEVYCGVVVREDGLIVTSGDAFPDPGGDPRNTLEPVAYAVLEDSDIEHPLVAVGLDRDLNLAFLRFEGGMPEGYRAIRTDHAETPHLGEDVLIIGLLPERYEHAITFWNGQISARVESPRTMYGVTNFIQDLSIGGLAVSARGKPLGIVAEDVLPTGRATGPSSSNPLTLFGSLSQGARVGYPMIFPFELLSEDIASPPALVREPRKAWFGITMQPLDRDLADYWNIDSPGGIIISAVLDGSPAQGAGLHPRDILLALGGKPITARELSDLATFRQRVEKLTIGEAVELLVWRNGEKIKLELHPGIAPRTGFLAQRYEDPDFGLTVRELTIDLLQARNLPGGTSGVLVTDLETAGWAQVAGVALGDIILRINRTPVVDLKSFEEVMNQLREERPREAYFFVQRNVETRFIKVRTDW